VAKKTGPGRGFYRLPQQPDEVLKLTTRSDRAHLELTTHPYTRQVSRVSLTPPGGLTPRNRCLKTRAGWVLMFWLLHVGSILPGWFV
jgi:hypothetical protein